MADTRILTLRDTQLLYRNFAGVEGKFNKAGNRNVTVTIDDPALVEDLIADGWNVRTQEPREEGDEPRYLMKVKVNFDSSRPPRVIMIVGKRRVTLDENSVAILDTADVVKADMTVVPYVWEIGDKAGTAAYLKTMYVTIEEDPLDAEYSTYDEEPFAIDDSMEAPF